MIEHDVTVNVSCVLNYLGMHVAFEVELGRREWGSDRLCVSR